MMSKAILDFNKQFDYKPVLENREGKPEFKNIILVGMGGSHLSAGILNKIKPELNIYIHKNYGLPKLSENYLKESLIILSSYSGNTEEVLSAKREASQRGLKSLTISAGGKLMESAQKEKRPFIKLPDTNIQPRMALGFSTKALMKVLGLETELLEVTKLKDNLSPESLKEQGKDLARKLNGKVPVIYASADNISLAYNWKIKFNETGKIPAFFNVFPELNHNEMTGFDVQNVSKNLSEKFTFILLRDLADYEEIQKRMDVLKQLYIKRGLKVEEIFVSGLNIYEKIFSTLIIGDWTALYIASNYGLESEQVPMIEEFKKLIEINNG